MLILLSFCSAALAGIAQTNTELVKNEIINFHNDFNNGSFKDAANYTTNDWEQFNPADDIGKERDSVLKLVHAVHQTFLKGVTIR